MGSGSLKIDFTKTQTRQQLGESDLLLLDATGGPQTVVELPLGQLTPYPDQPFRPYAAEKLDELSADIKANGVLSPIIVRPRGNAYQILAGHNRWNASRKAGLATIPAIVRDVDDDAAALILVNTNLNQRDQLLPSEKAFAYKIQLEIMSRQGSRTDLTCGQRGHKSRDSVGDESGRTIQRYICLTHLIPDLLDLVDSGELGLIPAVALSYLEKSEQDIVCEVCSDCDRKISVFQAEQLKKASKVGELDEQRIRDILLPQPAQRWNPRKVFAERGKALVPKTATQEQVDEVVGIVERYFAERAAPPT